MLAKTFLLGLLASVPLVAALEVKAPETALAVEERSFSVRPVGPDLVQKLTYTSGLSRC